MNDIQTVVLAKVVADKDMKAARAGLLPGVHPVDFTVRFHGVADVKEDYERRATTSIPWLEVTSLIREAYKVSLEALLSKVDAGAAVTREDIVEISENGPLAADFAVNVMRRAMENKDKATGKVKEVVELGKAVDDLLADFSARLPVQKVPGKVLLDVETDLVGVPAGLTADQIAEAIAAPQPRVAV